MTDALWKWDASALAQGIRARRISSRDAVTSCIERMHAVNPQLNAVVCDMADGARRDADVADAEVARGGALGPLHGVPVTIKENTDQAGCATVNGIAANRDLIATTDSPVVAHWKRAGAIIIGRTNTPAFSLRLDTVNDYRGRTFSPWSRAHTPGGSSGGAASAVAAGITPLAHGTDLAGSIRYPAYCCGLAGLRPSFGRVPSFNGTAAVERPISMQLMSVQGPIARSVRDVRLGFEAMVAGDARDPWWTPSPLNFPPATGRVRVAVVTDPADLGGRPLSASAAAAMQQAADALADAGYEVVTERTPGFARAFELWFAIAMPELRHFLRADIERLGDDGVRTAVELMAANVPDTDAATHLRALAERTRLIREWNQFLTRIPLVLAPVCTELPYAHGFDVESAARTRQVWEECATLMAIPVLGLPAMAVPTGVAQGLPVGVQVMGARFREDMTLAAAAAIEARCMRITPIDPK